MPYDSISELPKSVRNLPKRAKEIYMKAFNSAWNTNAGSADTGGESALEELSRDAAWSAVKQEYEKDEETGEWVKIEDFKDTRRSNIIRHRRRGGRSTGG